MSDERTELCERCGEELNQDTMIVLEYFRKDDVFKSVSPSGEYDEGFVFGRACAKSVLRNKGKLKRIKGYEG